jgi:hypothetical protein
MTVLEEKGRSYSSRAFFFFSKGKRGWDSKIKMRHGGLVAGRQTRAGGYFDF